MICLLFLFFSWEENDPARNVSAAYNEPFPILLEIPPSRHGSSVSVLQLVASGRGLEVTEAVSQGSDMASGTGRKSGRSRNSKALVGEKQSPLSQHLEGPSEPLYTKHMSSGKCHVPGWQSESPGRQKGNENFCKI